MTAAKTPLICITKNITLLADFHCLNNGIQFSELRTIINFREPPS